MYDMNRIVFASVQRNSEVTAACPDQPREPGEYFYEGYLEAYQSIDLNGLAIGSVMVRTSLIDLDRRLQSHQHRDDNRDDNDHMQKKRDWYLPLPLILFPPVSSLLLYQR